MDKILLHQSQISQPTDIITKPLLFQENREVAQVCEWVKGYHCLSVGKEYEEGLFLAFRTLGGQGVVSTFSLSCDLTYFCSVGAGG